MSVLPQHKRDADELGSGMRNTYKYTQLYSGGTPEFIKGDVFRTIIPLTTVAVEKVGPLDTPPSYPPPKLPPKLKSLNSVKCLILNQRLWSIVVIKIEKTLLKSICSLCSTAVSCK